jgi:hypothetical protein
LLFVATFFSNVNAQDFKLGKVSFAELQEKFHPDSAAVAAILYKRTGSFQSMLKMRVLKWLL